MSTLSNVPTCGGKGMSVTTLYDRGNPFQALDPPGKMVVRRQEPFTSSASGVCSFLLYKMLIKPQPSLSPGEKTLESYGRGPYPQAPSTTTSLLIPFKQIPLAAPEASLPPLCPLCSLAPHHLGITAFSFKPFSYQGQR